MITSPSVAGNGDIFCPPDVTTLVFETVLFSSNALAMNFLCFDMDTYPPGRVLCPHRGPPETIPVMRPLVVYTGVPESPTQFLSHAAFAQCDAQKSNR